MKLKSPFWSLIVILLGLSLLYVAIFMCFRYQMLGVLPGQDLNNSDWLSFLGSFLSFSGSLVMAIIVDRQQSIITQLTIDEYGPTFCSCISSKEYTPKCITNAGEQEYFLSRTHLEDNSKSIIAHFDSSLTPKNPTMLVFCVDMNCMSKMLVKSIHINRISIVSADNTKQEFQSQGCICLPQKGEFNYCICIQNFPGDNFSGIIEISFYCNNDAKTTAYVNHYITIDNGNLFLSP